MSPPSQIRAVAFKEGDVWVVQGIEYDIVAQAKDPFDAPAAFLKTLISTMAVNRKMGRDALACLKEAPERFLEMFENATLELKPRGVWPTDAYMPRPDIDMRGYREHVA